jgi:transcriptional regulator NrdR family protein
MKCPICGADTFVYDSRPNKSREVIRRRRFCAGAESHRFSTYELPYNGTRT